MGVRPDSYRTPPVQVKENRSDMAKIGTYIKESADELLNKVSWPTWPELQSSAVIVLVASVIFAVIIYLMDTSFSNLMKFIYGLF
jgi:preprotein translocase subunit SecE